jgi:hypothetical protein
MKIKTFLILILTTLSISLFSQKERTVFGKNGLRVTGFWGGPAVGLGQMDKELLVFRGGFGGLEFGNRLLIGWASYEIDNDVQIDAFDNDRFKMDYNGLLVGYTPHAHKRIHPVMMFLAGKGKAQVGTDPQENIFVIRPTLGLELNFFRWFHLGVDAGYQLVTNMQASELKQQQLSGLYAEIKMKFGFSW